MSGGERTEVTRDEFYGFVYGPPALNVHPHPEPHESVWREGPNGGSVIVGWSTPGYRRSGLEPKRYFLSESALSRARGDR